MKNILKIDQCLLTVQNQLIPCLYNLLYSVMSNL